MKALKYFACCLIFNVLPLKIHPQPQHLLKGTLHPVARFDYQKNIICLGRHFVGSFPMVAQKVDRKMQFLWPDNESGVNITNPTVYGDESRGGVILPHKDGSVFFACQYMQYLGESVPDERYPFVESLYRNYPVLQRISAEGEICWGENGICLSDTNIICTDQSGYTDLHSLSFDADGNVVLIWTWTMAENTTRTEIIEGTFMQKVNPVTGEVLLESVGKRILDKNVSHILEGKENNLFLFELSNIKNGEHEITKYDKNREMLWSLKVYEDLFSYSNVKASLTHYGDIFTLYVSKDINIRSSYISTNGEIIFQDRLTLQRHLVNLLQHVVCFTIKQTQ